MRFTGDGGAAALGQALLLGVGLGLLYDLLRPVRHRAGGAAPLLDLLFAVLAGFAAFLFAMRAQSGRMGLWELTAALAGFLLWEHFLRRFKQGLPAFFAKIRAKKAASSAKIRQKGASKN